MPSSTSSVLGDLGQRGSSADSATVSGQPEVAERTERTRGAQRVALPAQHPQPRGLPDRGRDDRRLPGAALAGDRDAHALAVEGLAQALPQDVELSLALEQPHGVSVRLSGAPSEDSWSGMSTPDVRDRARLAAGPGPGITA